jgi:hypothetical protein
LTVVASSPGSSLLSENDWSATGLRKMLFLGGEVGVSHSGTSGCVVAIEGCRCYCMLYIAERMYPNECNAMLAKWEERGRGWSWSGGFREAGCDPCQERSGVWRRQETLKLIQGDAPIFDFTSRHLTLKTSQTEVHTSLTGLQRRKCISIHAP